MKKTYKQLKKEPVECPYCNSKVHLLYINRHLKTEKCLEFKNLLHASMNEQEFYKYELDFLLFIKSLKEEKSI